MKITIIGSGLLGLSTAYHLLTQGHQVTIVERQSDSGLETSYANGGLLTPSLCEPWNAPGVFFNLLKYIGREDSPLLLRPKALPSLMFWGMSFLRYSTQSSYNETIFKNTRLAKYNLTVLDEMAKQIPMSDFGGGKSTMKVCRQEVELDEVLKMAEFLAPEKIPFKMLSRDEAFTLEPSLKPLGDKVAGGIYFPDDRFGDAHQYCVELAEYLKNNGVEFLYNTSVTNMHSKGGRITHIDTDQGTLDADNFVLSAGSFSPLLSSKVGVNIPVRPCKGYSLTLELPGWDNAPKIPVIDHSLHAAVTPLGNKIRVAGTAEFSGYDNELNASRLQNLFGLLEGIFPESTAYIQKEKTKEWTGLRPVSASGAAIIGHTKIKNLYVNTGQGHLGWTCAAGSGKALSDLISGKTPDINLSDYALR
jgi:D-amino-acid dehydrogenase